MKCTGSSWVAILQNCIEEISWVVFPTLFPESGVQKELSRPSNIAWTGTVGPSVISVVERNPPFPCSSPAPLSHSPPPLSPSTPPKENAGLKHPLPTNMERNPFNLSFWVLMGALRVSWKSVLWGPGNILQQHSSWCVWWQHSGWKFLISFNNSFLSNILSQEPTMKDLEDGNLDISGLLTPPGLSLSPQPLWLSIWARLWSCTRFQYSSWNRSLRLPLSTWPLSPQSQKLLLGLNNLWKTVSARACPVVV